MLIGIVLREAGGKPRGGSPRRPQWYNDRVPPGERGQVAQLVERSPEKAGVGGSIPSLATTFLSTCSHFTNCRCPITDPIAFQFTSAANFSTARSCDSGRSCS